MCRNEPLVDVDRTPLGRRGSTRRRTTLVCTEPIHLYCRGLLYTYHHAVVVEATNDGFTLKRKFLPESPLKRQISATGTWEV